MRSSDIVISIREVQHYAYCPHRWGLIHIGCDWSENAFVNKAKLIHERADSKAGSFLRGQYVERAVQIYHDGWNLFGVLDCLHLTPDKNGCYIEKYGQYFRLTVVEYKPGRPEREQARQADRMQLLAQKVCVDRMFGVDCETCFYYADTRRRQTESFCKEDYETLRGMIDEIRQATCEAAIPPVRQGQYCNGCSMKDICLPRIGKDYA